MICNENGTEWSLIRSTSEASFNLITTSRDVALNQGPDMTGNNSAERPTGWKTVIR